MYEQVDDADDRSRGQHGGDQHRDRDVPRPRAGHGLPRGPVRVGHGVRSGFPVGAEVRQTCIEFRSCFSEAFRSLLKKEESSVS